MFLKHRGAAPEVDDGQSQSPSLAAYFEAYRYSFELCNDPEIARQVASLYLECVGAGNNHWPDGFAAGMAMEY